MSDRENSRYKRYLSYLKKSPLLLTPLQETRGESVSELQFCKQAKMQGTENDGGTFAEGYDEEIIRQVSTCVLAPALDSYVIWVLQNALENGIRRLYFLARDGYFMYRAAEIFCQRFQLPIECRYLCCSRYSLRIPVFHLDTEEALEYICRGGIDVTMKNILERSGITEEEQKEVLRMLQLPFGEQDVIPYAELQKIREKLENCRYFLDCMCAHSREALPGLQGYLTQEGLLEEVPDAIVDSGWVGSMQKTLNQVLTRFGRKKVLEGYYWGLYELPTGVKREHYHCYYFNPEGNLREKVHFSNCLFEVIYSAPHGMTTGYIYDGNQYQPVYAPYDDTRKRFIQRTEVYLMQYTRQLAENMKDIYETDCDRERRAVKKLLKLFMGQPVPDEAEVYGSLEFSDDVLDEEKQQVAAPLTEVELRANHVGNKALVMLGIRQGYIKESAWYEGSAVRNQEHVRRHLISYRWYKYLLYLRQMYWKKK